MPRILIVAYGNPLRSDDGVAWRAADALERTFSNDQAEILRLHQLAPEVAEAVQHHDLVLFVDAACVDDLENARPGQVGVREISGEESRQNNPAQFSHVYPPAKILDLARELYQSTPKAFVITVAGEDFGHGESLSAPVSAALPELVTNIVRLVESYSPKS